MAKPKKTQATTTKTHLENHELRLTKLERDLALLQLDTNAKFGQIMSKIEEIAKDTKVFVSAADAMLQHFGQKDARPHDETDAERLARHKA